MKIFNLLGICCILLLWEVFKIFQRGRIILSFLTEIKEQVKEYAEIVAGFVDNLLGICCILLLWEVFKIFQRGRIILSFLTEIKEQVKEYAEIVAGFVDCEVEIVDENMLRIAATGKFAHLVGKFSKGAIYKDVLVTGESHVVENPSQHRLCADCEFKERCQEKLEIAAPIVHQGKSHF